MQSTGGEQQRSAAQPHRQKPYCDSSEVVRAEPVE